jgi:hypothetical protein
MLLAPWSVRPFLSAAFWIASWWWLPRLGPGRKAFLEAALLSFGILALMRLLKPIEFRRPSPASLVVGGTMALLAVLPFARSTRLPPDTTFDALSARLMADRDGVPATYEPLLPIPTFGLRPSGFAGLAADADLLSAKGSPEVVLAAAGAANALLVLAAFHVLRRLGAPTTASLVAAAIALGAALLAALPSGLVLGIGLALVASSHVISRHRAPTVAAGVLLGASALCSGIAVPLAALLAGASLRFATGIRSRVLLASGVAVLVVGPALPRGGAALVQTPRPSLVRSAERPTTDDRAAMDWLREDADPLAVVCASNTPVADWIPAATRRALVLEGRVHPVPAGLPALDPLYPCTLAYGSAQRPGEGTVLFQSGAVTLVEISKSLR